MGQLVGVEMGGVVASLYGATANLSSLEWDLLQLKLPETLSERSWVGKLLNPGGRSVTSRYIKASYLGQWPRQIELHNEDRRRLGTQRASGRVLYSNGDGPKRS